MLKPPNDLSAYNWPEDELARFNAYMASAEPLWDPSDPPDVAKPGPGHNGPPPSGDRPDPLAGLTPWQIFFHCIWISDEDTYTKIMLLCLARFMNKQLRGGSSMSYSQIAGDCGFSESTAKRCAKNVRERWLRIGVGKGRYVPGKGSENLYHGVVPQDLVDKLRRRKSGVSGKYPEISDEVSQGYPETDCGVSSRHPDVQPNVIRGVSETQPGCLADTTGVSGGHTNYSLSSNRKNVAATTRPDAPHLNAAGFIISAKHDLVVPMQKVTEWRDRFPDIPDLEAAMTGLATTILARGRMHPGWTCPEGWMVKPLADMNAEAADKKRVTAARLASAGSGSGRGKSRRAELDKL